MYLSDVLYLYDGQQCRQTEVLEIESKETLKVGKHSLRSKRFRGVQEQKKFEERDFRGVLEQKTVRRTGFRSFGRAKRGARAIFCSRPIFRAAKTSKIPFFGLFFALKPHGNACYAG